MPTGTTAHFGTTVVRHRKQRCSRGKVRGKIPVRFVKMTSGKWKRFAKHLWESINGPVPPGHRVYHLDGDNLNDVPENLAVMTPGEWLKHQHDIDPAMSRENRRGKKRREAIRKFNSESATVRRHLEFLPSYWYLVDDEKKTVVNQPYKSRRKLAAEYGIKASRNGRLPDGVDTWIMRGDQLNADEQRRHYKKNGNSPCEKSGLESRIGP